MVELLNQVLAKILDGPDYFRCEQLRVRMSKKRCIQRRDEGRLDCRYCEQGKTVRIEVEKVRREEGEQGTRLRQEASAAAEALADRSEGKEKEMEEYMANEEGMVLEDREKTLICRVCGGDKPLKEMVPNKRCRDGREKICKKCRGDQDKESYRAKKKRGGLLRAEAGGAALRRAGKEGKVMEHIVNDEGIVVEDMEKTYVRCRVCGRDKPPREMVPNKRCRDGCEKICKKCRGDQNKEAYRARMKQDKSDVKGKVKRRKKQDRLDDSVSKTADDPFIFILSGLMADNPKIREGLLTTAKEEFRTPEGQAMWYIKRGLKMDGMKKIANIKRWEV